MIDTIKLLIEGSRFRCIRPELFMPNLNELFRTRSPNKKGRVVAYQNPSSKDIKEGHYKPSLSVTYRGDRSDLLIQFSVPKLLYGNNFEEVEESDFDTVIGKLASILQHEMGISISHEALISAPVSQVDFCKNIVFQDYTVVSGVLTILSKAIVPKYHDLKKVDYKDGGHSLHVYCHSRELVFYDKIAELRASKHRAVEKEDREFNLQPSLFQPNKERAPPFEVLRIERRLKNKRMLRTMLDEYGLKFEPNFKNLFSVGLSKQIIWSAWNDLVNKSSYLAVTDLDMFTAIEIISQKTGWKGQKLAAFAGLLVALQQGGERALYRAFRTRGCPTTFRRMMDEIKQLDLPLDQVKFQPIFTIDEQIQIFKSLKFSHYGLHYNYGPKHGF